MKKELKITGNRLFSQMIIFAIPVILSGVLQTLYNAADSLIVGRFDSANALGAVGSVTSVIHIFVNLFIGLTIGTNVIVARHFGGENMKMVKKASDTAIVTGLFSGIIVGAIGYFAAPDVARIMKIDPEIIDMSILYMKVYFLGMPFMALYNFIAAALRGIGDTKSPMISLIISGLVNVVLNYVFVRYLHMGVAGVAWATVISQIVSLIMILYMLKKSPVGFSAKSICFDKKAFINTVQIGLPASIQSITFSLSNTLLSSAINSFGAAAAAGSAIEGQIDGIIYVAVNSLTQTVTTFTSQSIGAGKNERIGRILAYGLAISMTIGAVLSYIAYNFMGSIIDLFAPGDAEVAKFAIVKFKYVIIPYFLVGFMEMPAGTLRGMSRTFISMIMSILGVCGVRILWLFLVFPFMRTPEVLFLCYPVSWFVTGVTYFIAYAIIKKQNEPSYSSP